MSPKSRTCSFPSLLEIEDKNQVEKEDINIDSPMVHKFHHQREAFILKQGPRKHHSLH